MQVESQAAAEESAAPPAASGEELVLPAESHTEHHQQEQQQEEQQAAEGHEGNTMSTASAAPASPDGPEEAAVTAPGAEEEELLSAAQLPPANPAPQSAPEAAAAVTGDEGQPQPEHAAEAEQQQHKPAQAVGEHHAPHHLSKPAGQQPAAPQRVEYKAASAGANRCVLCLTSYPLTRAWRRSPCAAASMSRMHSFVTLWRCCLLPMCCVHQVQWRQRADLLRAPLCSQGAWHCNSVAVVASIPAL